MIAWRRPAPLVYSRRVDKMAGDMSETNERLLRIEQAQNEMAQTLAEMRRNGELVAQLSKTTEQLDRKHAVLENRVDSLYDTLKPLMKLPEQVATLIVVSKASTYLAGAVVVGMISLVVVLLSRVP
jgi:hypothetical protein